MPVPPMTAAGPTDEQLLRLLCDNDIPAATMDSHISGTAGELVRAMRAALAETQRSSSGARSDEKEPFASVARGYVPPGWPVDHMQRSSSQADDQMNKEESPKRPSSEQPKPRG